jgi:hypothetical protein
MNEFDYDLTDVESEFFAAGDDLANPERGDFSELSDEVPALSLWQRIRRSVA